MTNNRGTERIGFVIGSSHSTEANVQEKKKKPGVRVTINKWLSDLSIAAANLKKPKENY